MQLCVTYLYRGTVLKGTENNWKKKTSVAKTFTETPPQMGLRRKTAVHM